MALARDISKRSLTTGLGLRSSAETQHWGVLQKKGGKEGCNAPYSYWQRDFIYFDTVEGSFDCRDEVPQQYAECHCTNDPYG